MLSRDDIASRGFLSKKPRPPACMIEDLTLLDSYAWEALKKALNQRVVVTRAQLLPSRHNRVWLVETDVRPLIVKKYLTRKGGVEFEALVKARQAGLDVPYPVHRDEEHIVMEYIPGESCETLVNHMFSAEAAEGIGRWLAEFHARVEYGDERRLRGDVVLSNFVYWDGRVFGLDLEEVRRGDPLDDLGQLAASILGSEPFFTPIKFDLCFRAIRGYERVSGKDVMERVRLFAAEHLRRACAGRPLLRRTLLRAAKSLEKGWPDLA